MQRKKAFGNTKSHIITQASVTWLGDKTLTKKEKALDDSNLGLKLTRNNEQKIQTKVTKYQEECLMPSEGKVAQIENIEMSTFLIKKL